MCNPISRARYWPFDLSADPIGPAASDNKCALVRHSDILTKQMRDSVLPNVLRYAIYASTVVQELMFDFHSFFDISSGRDVPNTILPCSDTCLLELIAVLMSERVTHVTPIATGPNSDWSWTRMDYFLSNRTPFKSEQTGKYSHERFLQPASFCIGKDEELPSAIPRKFAMIFYIEFSHGREGVSRA